MSPMSHAPLEEFAGIEAELSAYADRTQPVPSAALLERLELVLAAQLPPPEPVVLAALASATATSASPAGVAAAPRGRWFAFGSPARLTFRVGLAMGLLALSAVGVFAANGILPPELLPWRGGPVAAPTPAPTPEPTPPLATVAPASPRVLVSLPAAPVTDPGVPGWVDPSADPLDDGDGSGSGADDGDTPGRDAPGAVDDRDSGDGGGDDSDDRDSNDGEDGDDGNGSGDDDGSDGSDGGDDGSDDGSGDGEDPSDEPDDGSDDGVDGGSDGSGETDDAPDGDGSDD